MPNLTQADYNEIYQLLEPLVETEHEQRMMISAIFIGSPKRPQMKYGTTAWLFARHVVDELHDYPMADNTNALAALLESIKGRVDANKEARIDVLLQRMQPSDPPKEQSQCQTRPRNLTDILPPPFAWCNVTTGIVTLEDIYGKYPGFHVTTFQIAKYPITVAQYQTFIDESGYEDERWWLYSPAAKKFWQSNGKQFEENYFDGNDIPRTNVSWYEACAFCHWLSFETNLKIVLPHEAQWQRAAQGDDGRSFPWGNEFDSRRCNTYQSGFEQPTEVTRYDSPFYFNGLSPFGVADMAGNVQEWCVNDYQQPKNKTINSTYRASVRGGAYNSDPLAAHTTFRSDRTLYYRHRFVGFRVVCENIASSDTT